MSTSLKFPTRRTTTQICLLIIECIFQPHIDHKIQRHSTYVNYILIPNTVDIERLSQNVEKADIHLSDVLLEIWENLLAVIRGQYDNMQGSRDTVNKRRKKLLHLRKKLPLLQCQLKSLNGNIDFHGLFLEYQQMSTPSTKFEFWS